MYEYARRESARRSTQIAIRALKNEFPETLSHEKAKQLENLIACFVDVEAEQIRIQDSSCADGKNPTAYELYQAQGPVNEKCAPLVRELTAAPDPAA